MQPTLYDGDRVLVRYGRSPRPGDVVVVRLPDAVVAIKRAVRQQPSGWWVERDNPEEGVDSWAVGEIPDDFVIAVVTACVWPPRRLSRCRRRQ